MNGQSSFGFGSTANTTSQAGTLFGAPNTNNTSAGTLFGANTSNSSAAGTLFGGAASSNTGFGGFSKPATTSAFGAPTTTQPATPGFGGFGAPTTSTAPTATGFGGFGAPATSTAPGATGFGGFGQQQAPAAATGFGGFGAPATSTAPAATGFGGFGQTANTGFGQQQQQQPTTGFGQQPTTGFGQPASTGFGKPANTGFGFGQPASNNLFGNNNNQQQQQQQQQQMGAAPVQDKVWQELALIRAHFDPTSPLCQFRHYFYNMVPANEVHFYVRPQNQDEQLWNEAVRKNPDPTCLVPVLAVGFDDILKRMEIQSKQVDLHQEKLKETRERLNTVQRQYALGTLVKLEEHKRRHTYLAQRLLRLLRYSQVLRYKGFPLNADEEKSMSQLHELATSPNNPENIQQNMTVLWNQLQAIKAQRSTDSGKAEVWRTVRERDTAMIAKILEDEQKGIMHVASILKSDAKELEVIEVGLKNNHNRMN
ncbi:hypothetical protein MFLAVUS_009774 [Mucor flavus]|uniref:Nucleoporin Nup54 alpha-helical domain-containing protein n=1 Tax=Mucor flavus TaxID=439312 RepID=A0ABP9ZAV4_9FUNG